MYFDPKKTPNDSFFFIYDNYINFIYTWGNFDWSFKVTPGTIKVTPSAIKVTPFDRVTLIGNSMVFDSEYLQKKLIVTYRKSIELKANYHIVLHSVAGACVILHIFKTFEKPPKSIKVPLFHGIYKLFLAYISDFSLMTLRGQGVVGCTLFITVLRWGDDFLMNLNLLD